MEKFILIETSTDACSVAIATKEGVIASDYIQEHKAHARLLIPMVEKLLETTGTKIGECSAVAVSEGPGSYTGLRVGVSSAKGLCYGSGIKLLSVPTLDILAQMGKGHISDTKSIIIPMLDARRMEVYCAPYNSEGVRLSEVRAEILDEHSFEKEFEEYNQVIFIGDGAVKFRQCLSEEQLSRSLFVDCRPEASYMLNPVLEQWNKKEFKDIAYFEPFYLKDFIAGVSKKSLI